MNISFAVQISDNDDAFFIMIVVQKPSSSRQLKLMQPAAGVSLPWRLADHQAANGKKAAHDALHEQRNAPRPITLYEAAKIIKPNAGSVSADIARELDACEFPTIVGR